MLSHLYQKGATTIYNSHNQILLEPKKSLKFNKSKVSFIKVKEMRLDISKDKRSIIAHMEITDV